MMRNEHSGSNGHGSRKPKVAGQRETYVVNASLEISLTPPLRRNEQNDMESAPRHARRSASLLCLGNHYRGHGHENLVQQSPIP